MKPWRKTMSVAMMAAIPLAYHRLYKKTFGNRSESQQMKVLPNIEHPENDFFLEESGYAQSMNDMVLPYLAQRETRAYYQTTHQIHYARYQADTPTASVVISHGYAEEIDRYAEPIYYFLKMGYNVFIPEHFGHGKSEAGVSDPTLIWVDDFDTYSFDFYRFIQDVVRPEDQDRPVVCFGHSMGGAVLARTLQLYNDCCSAAILSSPMLQVHLFQAESLIFPITQAVSKTPWAKALIPGETRFTKQLPDEFNPERAAMRCQVRGEYVHRLRWDEAKQPRYAVSWGWLSESLKAGHEIVKPENVRKINVPMLMFQSETDWYVDARGMYEFAEHAKNLDFYQVPNTLHEIYSESNEVIIPYFNRIHHFIEETVARQLTEHQSVSIPSEY